MKLKIIRLLLLFTAVVLLVACGGGAAGPSVDIEATVEARVEVVPATPTLIPTPTATSTPTPVPFTGQVMVAYHPAENPIYIELFKSFQEDCSFSNGALLPLQVGLMDAKARTNPQSL